MQKIKSSTYIQFFIAVLCIYTKISSLLDRRGSLWYYLYISLKIFKKFCRRKDMRKESNRKNAKSYIRVIALFLCALIFSSCTNCASCNFADLFNIEIIPDASEKESASGIEGSSDEEKHTHTHSEMPTEKQTELPTEEPTEPVPEWNEDIKHEIQFEYWEQFVHRGHPNWESDYNVQFLGKFSDAYAVNVLNTGMTGNVGAYFIEGYEFRYRRDNPPYIYRQGKFYTLENALSSGMITLDDLDSINTEFKQMNREDYKYIYNLRDSFV